MVGGRATAIQIKVRPSSADCLTAPEAMPTHEADQDLIAEHLTADFTRGGNKPLHLVGSKICAISPAAISIMRILVGWGCRVVSG